MSWTASIHTGKPPTDDNLVARATSTAEPNELPELAIEDPAFLADVSLAFVQAWEGPGPTGTGTVGEVQDMVHTMGVVATELDLVLEVPAETTKKVTAERKASKLPQGAVW